MSLGGVVIDRDLNASINIARKGKKYLLPSLKSKASRL